MSVLNALALDHFYISLSEKQISILKDLTEKLNGSYSKVQSGQDSWEGLYTSSRIGDYVEFLQSRKSGGFGIALSAQHLAYTNVKNLLNETPSSQINIGTRVDSSGEPWLDWYSAVPYEDHENLVFNFWVMDYYKSHVDYKTRIKRRLIDSFDFLEGSVGEKYLQEFDRAKVILPYETKIESDQISFSVPRRDEFHLDVSIKIIPGESRFRAEKMGFTMYSNSGVILGSTDFPYLTSPEANKFVLNFDLI